MDERGAVRFNLTHVPAGSATGGQFGTSSGGSSAKSGAKAPAKTPAKAAPAHHMSAAHAAEKARLLAQAHKDAAEAAVLEKQLAGLEKQAATASAAAKKSAAAAKASLKAGHVVHHRKHAAHHAHHSRHHQSLKQKISALKGRIHALRVQAAGLEKQANAIRSGDSGIPGHLPHQLADWWERGPGAARIGWDTPGSFDRCVRLAVSEAHMDPERAKGFCAERHHAATGTWPGQKHAGRAAMTTPDYDPDGLDGSWDGDCSDLPDLTGLDVSHLEAAEGEAPSQDPASRAMPKLGSGARFKKLSASLAAKGARDPGALAAYIGRKKLGKAKFGKIAAKARGKGGASRMSEDRSQRLELFRSYPLEDAHVITRAEGDGSGRLVEAYCAVFGEAAEIYDHQGHYREDIDRAAFNKRIADVQRSRAGFGLVKCIYNHGLTLMGTPAERFSLPPAVCKHISAESRGVLTRSYYLDTPLGNELLEMWREGAISAQSFTGAIIRSSPELRRGEKYRPRDGQLPQVTRLELGLKEYGATPFPAYSGAELVGVRMSPLGTWQAADDDGTEEHDEHEEQALPPDGEAAAGSPLTRTYGDSDKHEARYHQHALYVLRSKEAREKAGLVF